MALRINKYLADRQYASRREADRLVESGVVFINGKKAVLGDMVLEEDVVTVRGKTSAEKAYYAYFKPKGLVTVNAQEGEKEILDVMEFPTKVYPLGRLDKESEGLIIFTNDGRLTDLLLNPEFKHEKEYSVTVNKPIQHTFLVHMRNGVNIGTVGFVKNYKTKAAKVRRTSPKTFDITLTEGKNRQIRRMVAALGYKVIRLRRFRIETIELGKLKPGQFRIIKDKELDTFLKTLTLTQ